MTHIELYINNQLCDIENPGNIGVRLNRVIISPGELNTKDAQYSYSLTIPSSPVNDAIFHYAGVEEVNNKFNYDYRAQLYVDSVLVFDGEFKLSEIDSYGSYKGNLVLPVKKTIKEIFGEKKMNEIAEWRVDVKRVGFYDEIENFPDFISRINTTNDAPCIFPLVLYGLLPKVPQDKKIDGKEYSSKKEWDDTVRFRVEDFPPSVNCLQMLEHLIGSTPTDDGKTAKLTGTALDDERLRRLYVSYQNPTDYNQPWHWGSVGKMHIKGEWTNLRTNGEDVWDGSGETEFFRVSNPPNTDTVAVNLFNSKNAKITVVDDPGNNIIQSDIKDDKGNVTKHTTNIRVPVSGLYKISLNADMALIDGGQSTKSIVINGVRLAYPNSYESRNGTEAKRYELKLLRSRNEGGFDMENTVIDGVYFQKNQKSPVENAYKDTPTPPMFTNYPLYFPVADPESVLFVDPAQNSKFVCGFRWGVDRVNFTHNPMGKEQGLCSVLAAKHGASWDSETTEVSYCATKNTTGYWEYNMMPKNDSDDDDSDDDDSETPGDDTESENKELGYKQSDLYKINLAYSPRNFATLVTPEEDYKGTIFEKFSPVNFGKGSVNMIVWLDRGESLTLVDACDIGTWRKKKGKDPSPTYVKHAVAFDLQIEPFHSDLDWLEMDGKGSGTKTMDWNSTGNFSKDFIDLAKFLPSTQKVDEWIDNFCKAFNLELIQPEPYVFELNLKQKTPASAEGLVVDLDHKVSIAERTNQPLGLPSAYKISFKVDKDEEGYDKSNEFEKGPKDGGGGTLLTGNTDGKELAQTSTFSYNWFKNIRHEGHEIDIPVITHKEIWNKDEVEDYKKMMPKLYTDYAQRFWYKKDVYNGGNAWHNGRRTSGRTSQLRIALLSNSLIGDKPMTLNYHYEPHTLLTTYFGIIATEDNSYTLVEGYLTPQEYDELNGTKLVKLNGDLYYVAAVEGYDPTGQNKTRLKLIRRM